MCGICGSAGRGGGEPGAVRDQLRVLTHRGPDSTGVYEASAAALGQARLAVIDLVTGDPPVTNEDGTVGVALNGEIYGYRQLRHELRGKGHTLRTEGDTEVIAHLAEDHDAVGLARRLDGMFAFAVWDDRRSRLTLGRDRLGKKPLYYWWGDGLLVFGSEIKAVLAHPAVPRRLHPDAIPTYLTFGYVPTPATFFEGVRSLPPGHVLTLEPGGEPVVEAYWQPPIPGVGGVAPLGRTLPQAARDVRSTLCAAVERRLVADVPIGAFLSGGVDSSAVVALMAELGARPLSTFTIGFEDDEGYDERPYARLVAERFGTDHTEFVVKPDAAELVERLVWHYDQPFGDSSALPTFLLCELTRRHVTVALCGDGGDELFAGYERFTAAHVHQRLRMLPAPLRSSLRRLVGALPARSFGGRARSLQRLLSIPQADVLPVYRSWVSFVPAELREDLAPGTSPWALDDYERAWRGSEGASLLGRLLDLNLRTYLLDDLLPKADRMSMAHGLELRSPMLDAELVDLALRLPDRHKLWGASRKRVLKAAVRDLLPRRILHRRKRGFGVPLDRWFRTELASYLDAMLVAPDSRLHGRLRRGAVERVVREHQRGLADHGHVLWTLLTLEVFLRREGW